MIIIGAENVIKLSFTVAAPISLSNRLRKSEAVGYAAYELFYKLNTDNNCLWCDSDGAVGSQS